MKMLRPQFSVRTVFALVAVFGIVFTVVPHFVTGYHDYYTCALCRTMRVEYIYWGINWGTSTTETACTPWYRDHVESVHNHVWIHSRASALRTLYGERFGAIDRDPPGRVIWHLTPEDQIAVYEHLRDPLEGKELFLFLSTPNSRDTNQDVDIIRSLQSWKESGFQGPWQSTK